jgi:hypothetical protein
MVSIGSIGIDTIKMNNPTVRKFENFIKDLGLKVEVLRQSSRDEPRFVSKTIFIDGWIWYILRKKEPKIYYINQITHELGHFLIAPKSRRYKKDYGIPLKNWKNRYKNRDYWDLDEFKAQLVGFYLLQHFKFTKNKKISWSHPTQFRAIKKEAVEWFNEIGKNKIDLILKSRKLD